MNSQLSSQLASQLASQIDPWLEHMRWRPDFAAWREKRLRQEHHQHEALRLLAEGRSLAGCSAGNASGSVALLDLGCGMGGFAVAAALQGADVVALDYNPAYCAITAQRAALYGLSLPVMQAAGEALPLPAARFDVITCWDVLEHVQSPDLLLAELARVLRPGGCLLLTAINRFALRDPHYHLPLINWLPRPWAEALITLSGRRKGGRFRDRQRLSSMHYVTWGGLVRLAARHGLRVYDLDARRVQRGNLGTRRRWLNRLAAQPGGRALVQTMAPPAYLLYRTVVQGTWRLALVKETHPR